MPTSRWRHTPREVLSLPSGSPRLREAMRTTAPDVRRMGPLFGPHFQKRRPTPTSKKPVTRRPDVGQEFRDAICALIPGLPKNATPCDDPETYRRDSEDRRKETNRLIGHPVPK